MNKEIIENTEDAVDKAGCNCRGEHQHGPEISCGCSHCHSTEEGNQEEELGFKKICAALALFVAGVVVEHVPFFEQLFGGLNYGGQLPVHRAVYLVFYAVAFILCGKDVVKNAVHNILEGEVFDETFLMTVASLGAVILGEAGEAVAVMLFYCIGEFFQDYAVDKSRDSISALMNIRPDKAFVVLDEKVVELKPEEVEVGQLIEVKPGERVPLDGTLEKGQSFMDTSALTGESVPRTAAEGSAILAGFVNQNSVVRIRVTKPYGQSAVDRILELTQEAGEVKAKSEKFITRFARVYTPFVCGAAALVAFVPPVVLQFFAPELFASFGWNVWIYRALTFLVVSCPCALVISVPLSFFGGIGAASRHGILVKGSNFVEVLAKAETAVFDKTGTLTKGVFNVTRIVCAGDLSEEELLSVAAHAEKYSNHPIAASVKAAHEEKTGGNCAGCKEGSYEQVQEISGGGVQLLLDGKKVCAGNLKLMETNGIDISQVQLKEGQEGTVVHVAVDGRYQGYIEISDELKEDSVQALKELKKLGVKKTVMLTGDNQKAALSAAGRLGIDKVYAELLPEGKVNCIEELLQQKKKGTVLFTGDGVNDSPVLARADAGIAMGALGSDAAIEAADVVIMDDKPSRLPEAVKLCRSTMAVVYQNIWLSLGVKAAIMVLGALGIANMWIAVFGDVGVCFIAILNSMRMLKK